MKPGDVVRIPPHTLHSIKCDSATTLRYLSVDAFVGEKPAAEPTWDSHVQTLCARFRLGLQSSETTSIDRKQNKEEKGGCPPPDRFVAIRPWSESTRSL